MTKQIPIHFYKKNKDDIKLQKIISFLIVICLLFICLFLNYVNKEINEISEEVKTISEEQTIISEPLTTQEKIIKYSKEYKVDTKLALDIAECESQFGKYNRNWEGSSAKGVYQFIDSTWDYFCRGDVMNEDDNIKCFMEIYNNYSHYWDECNN